jgi:hypothetical protein
MDILTKNRTKVTSDKNTHKKVSTNKGKEARIVKGTGKGKVVPVL